MRHAQLRLQELRGVLLRPRDDTASRKQAVRTTQLMASMHGQAKALEEEAAELHRRALAG